MFLQQTIRKAVECSGIGLHSGLEVKMTLRPALADTGIVFRLMTTPGVDIEVNPQNIKDHNFATSLGKANYKVKTVEHLLASLSALGIDNIYVDLNAAEIPAMDGSAMPFVDLIYSAGKEIQPLPKVPIYITEPIQVEENDRWILILPSDEFKITYAIDIDHPNINSQMATFRCDEKTFIHEIAGARTYGFLRDVEGLRKNGFARGGSLDNAIVIGSKGVLNGGLRYDNEFVRHKILDLIGDMKLLGRPVIGHVIAKNAGHVLNHRLVWKIFTKVQDSALYFRGHVKAMHEKVQRMEGELRHSQSAIA